MRGTIVLDNDAGRALRNKRAPVRTGDVLYCAGGFCAGDAIYIAFRTFDGSQYVVATGIARCDEGALREAMKSGRRTLDALEERCNAGIVVVEHDVQLLWPKS